MRSGWGCKKITVKFGKITRESRPYRVAQTVPIIALKRHCFTATSGLSNSNETVSHVALSVHSWTVTDVIQSVNYYHLLLVHMVKAIDKLPQLMS